MEVCENCGLPAWAVTGRGYKVVIYTKAERFLRSRKRTVWCHDEECAVQALAVSRYGAASHRWPITLAQFRSLPDFQETIRRSACYEIPSQPIDSTRPENGKNEESTSDAQNQFRNAGRPRKHDSAAARQRAYRDRKSEVRSIGLNKDGDADTLEENRHWVIRETRMRPLPLPNGELDSRVEAARVRGAQAA